MEVQGGWVGNGTGLLFINFGRLFNQDIKDNSLIVLVLYKPIAIN